jgi:hypothetical protein
VRKATCFGLLLLAVASAIRAETPSVAHLDDPVFGFSVDLPSIGDPSDALVVQRLIVMGPAVEGFAPNCNLQIQYTSMGLAAYLDLTRRQFIAHGATLVTESQELTYGLPGARIEYTASGSHRLRHLALAVAGSDRVWLLTCTALDASFAQHRPTFEQIIQSFTPKQEPPSNRR